MFLGGSNSQTVADIGAVQIKSVAHNLEYMSGKIYDFVN